MLNTSYKIAKWWFIAPVALLLILTSTYAAGSKPSDLSLTIVVPVLDGKRTIQVGHRAIHFKVVIKNLSKHPVKLWQEKYSWGYFNLKFLISNDKGDTWVVKKKEIDWEKNYPALVSVAPGDKMVIDVMFSPDIWENMPPPGIGKSSIVSMQAIYESAASKDATKKGVWFGKLISDRQEYTLLQ